MYLSDWVERVDLSSEIQEVYLHSFLFKLAVKLVSIFLPLYILELGYSVSTVLVFFMVYYSAFIVFSLFNAKISSRLGYKHASLLSSPFILLFYLALRFVPENSFWIYPVGFLGGYAFNLYWVGMNPEISKSSEGDDRGEDAGFFFSMPSLASIFAPAVGGLILAVSNFAALFLLTALIVGTSFLPFLFSKEHHEGMTYKPRKFLTEIDKIDIITFFVKGINSIGKKVLWPLYLAIIITGSVKIGGAGSFLSLGSAIASIGIGKILKDETRSKVIMTGATLTALTLIAMSQVTQPVTAFIASGINGLAYTAVLIPVYSKAMEHSEQDLVEYFAFREIALSTGRITATITLLTLFTFLPQQTAFLAGFTLFAAAVITTGILGTKMK